MKDQAQHNRVLLRKIQHNLPSLQNTQTTMSGRADCCNVGTSFTSRRWLSLNACGLGGISCSAAIHVFAAYTGALHLIEGSFLAQIVFILLYLPLSFMALWSLFMAWTTNPGAVPMGARPLVTVSRAASGEMSPSEKARKRGMRRCQKCNDNYKPSRAHHDSVTGRCIVKFDHYCPWVCNAVGAMNHKFFVLFVFYTMNTCITSILLIIMRTIRCGHKYDPSEDSPGADTHEAGVSSSTGNSTGDVDEEVREEEAKGDLDEGRDLLRGLQSMAPTSAFVYEECEGFHSTWLVIVLFCVAVTFMIFTSCMMVEQIEAIQTNQGKIARMKMRVGQGGTELRRVTEEFNEMFGGDSPSLAWHWFVPLPVQFPGSMHKVVMGYEWDPTFDPIPFREDRSTGGDGSSTCSSSDPTSTTDDTGTESHPPRDLEKGLVATDMDEVALDAPVVDSVPSESPGRLKKRSVSNGSVSGGVSLPELT